VNRNDGHVTHRNTSWWLSGWSTGWNALDSAFESMGETGSEHGLRSGVRSCRQTTRRSLAGGCDTSNAASDEAQRALDAGLSRRNGERLPATAGLLPVRVIKVDSDHRSRVGSAIRDFLEVKTVTQRIRAYPEENPCPIRSRKIPSCAGTEWPVARSFPTENVLLIRWSQVRIPHCLPRITRKLTNSRSWAFCVLSASENVLSLPVCIIIGNPSERLGLNPTHRPPPRPKIDRTRPPLQHLQKIVSHNQARPDLPI
jgi:hypothetical protein